MSNKNRRATDRKLVRFVSPFGSPAWMPRDRAERLLAEDDARYLDLQERRSLGSGEHAVTMPRIETGR